MDAHKILGIAQYKFARHQRLIAYKQAKVALFIAQGNYDAAVDQTEALVEMHLGLAEELRSFVTVQRLLDNRYIASIGH